MTQAGSAGGRASRRQLVLELRPMGWWAGGLEAGFLGLQVAGCPTSPW